MAPIARETVAALGAMKQPSEMVGDSLREAGVLVVVFHGLTVLIPQGRGLGVADYVGAVAGIVLGLVLWWYGATIELEG